MNFLSRILLIFPKIGGWIKKIWHLLFVLFSGLKQVIKGSNKLNFLWLTIVNVFRNKKFATFAIFANLGVFIASLFGGSNVLGFFVDRMVSKAFVIIVERIIEAPISSLINDIDTTAIEIMGYLGAIEAINTLSAGLITIMTTQFVWWCRLLILKAAIAGVR